MHPALYQMNHNSYYLIEEIREHVMQGVGTIASLTD